jgi:hypothetical protein
VLPLIAFALCLRRLSTDARVRMTLTAAWSYFALFALLLLASDRTRRSRSLGLGIGEPGDRSWRDDI